MEEMIIEKIVPQVEYRVRQTGIGYNCFVPQYKKKSWYAKWRDCTERKYDGRDGEWYDSRFTFDTLEKATSFIEKEIEKNTVIIYNKKSWFK
jgi:hypothetical protein